MIDEIKNLDKNEREIIFDPSIRPQNLLEFIGQKKIKNNLSIFIKSALDKEKPLDHVILYGPPGLGKTTIAKIVAKEMGVNITSSSGPILAKAGDIAAILTNLADGDVLFIDEIHRLNKSVEEMLYSAMEDFSLDIIIGEGPAARSVKIELPKFTLIGATTRIGLLSNPMRDRFGIPLRLEFYEADELSHIIKRAAKIIGAQINEVGAMEIAKRSRGTPRIALRLIRRVCDFLNHYNSEIIDLDLAHRSLMELGVDPMGLDDSDKRYVNFIMENYAGGPVGIETISAGLAEQKDTVEETIEPFLIQIGFLQRTSRGRVLARKCFDHFGIAPPKTLDQLEF